MYVLLASKRFQKQLDKLSRQNPRLKSSVSKILLLLVRNPKHPFLRLHKLSGRNVYSVSVTRRVRIIIGIRGKRIYLLRIGLHD